mgnify:FL=1
MVLKAKPQSSGWNWNFPTIEREIFILAREFSMRKSHEMEYGRENLPSFEFISKVYMKQAQIRNWSSSKVNLNRLGSLEKYLNYFGE